MGITRFTSKKVYRPPVALNTVKFNVSTLIPRDPRQYIEMETQRARRDTAKINAERFFRKTQENIIAMGISDKGYLLKSGYIHKEPDSDAWVVGYSAPYAEPVDTGTGPLAGHGPYSAPPPFAPILAWVRRNIAAFGTEEIVQRRGGEYRKTFKRIKARRQGQTVYTIKPRKPPREVAYRFQPMRRKSDEELIQKVARKVQMKIYRMGTAPKPFWRKALMEARAESEHLERQEHMNDIKRDFMRGVRKGFFKALRAGLKVVGGRVV